MPVETSDSASQQQPVRRILVFTIVALALMMMSIDMTIVATALHALQNDLDTSVNWTSWTITACSFGFADNIYVLIALRAIQAWVYVAAALFLVAALPLVGRVQEHKGSW